MLLGLTYQLIRFIADLVLVRTRSNVRLRAEVLALRHQLSVLERRVGKPAWQPGDRLLLAALSRLLPRSGWSALLPRPESLLRWHCDLVRRKGAAFRQRCPRQRPACDPGGGRGFCGSPERILAGGYRRIQGEVLRPGPDRLMPPPYTWLETAEVRSMLTRCSHNVSVTPIPRPQTIVYGDGAFELGPETGVRGPLRLTALARRYRGPPTGFSFMDGGTGVAMGIDASLPEEGYRLRVDADGVHVWAGDEAGAVYGVQTLLQLLPPDIHRRAPLVRRQWSVPFVTIDDAPRFSWRGSHLDVSRHIMPKDFLFRFVDLLALHKLNVFHLHLTDDQGWRFESLRYPRLTEVASLRRETQGNGTPHGGFYSQDDLCELVAYAAPRAPVIRDRAPSPTRPLATSGAEK